MNTPRRPPLSLRARLAIGAAALVIGAVAATGIVDAVVLRHFLQAQIDSRLDTQLNTLAAALAPGPGAGLRLVHPVEGPPFDRPDSGWYWEVLSGGAVVARSLSLEHGLIAPPPVAPAAPPPAPDVLPPAAPPPPPSAGEAPGPGDVPLRVRFRDGETGEPIWVWPCHARV